jgi:hypothetical protein
MLILHADQPDTPWDQLLPEGVRTLPEDLARLDQVLSDPQLLAPFLARFQSLAAELDADPLTRGRPTMPMATYLRLMITRAPHRMGLPDPAHRGVGLAAPATVLPDPPDLPRP